MPDVIRTEADFELSRQRLLKVLLQHSYQYRDEPFVLKSGAKSHHYVDCRLTTLNPLGAALVGELFLYLLMRYAPSVRAIGGLTVGADPIITAVGIASIHNEHAEPVSGLIVRGKQKDHGAKDLVIGVPNIPSGSLVALGDDVLTSGSSLLEAYSALQSCGLVTKLNLVIVDRQEQGGKKLVEDTTHAPVVSLFTLQDFAAQSDSGLMPFDFGALSPAA